MEWNGMQWRSLIFIRKNTSFHTTFSLYFFFLILPANKRGNVKKQEVKRFKPTEASSGFSKPAPVSLWIDRS